MLSACCNQLCAAPESGAAAYLPVLATILSVPLSVWLTYRYALKQKDREPYAALRAAKYQRQLDALQQCWSLLAYMAETENSRSIVVWERTGSTDRYYIRWAQLAEFRGQLEQLFYTSGHGLYLSKEIKQLLFEYRSQIYGLALKHGHPATGREEIRKVELAKRLYAIYDSLVFQIRAQNEDIDDYAWHTDRKG